MARRSKKRTMSARIVLTAEAYEAVEVAAFKNCRTVSQELTYRIEGQIGGKGTGSPLMLTNTDATMARYDAPAASQDAPQALEPSLAALPAAGWTPEQEAEIYALGQAAGLGAAQVTALRLIHKDYGFVVAAIEAERVPA